MDTKGHKILIADDEPDILKSFPIILKKKGMMLSLQIMVMKQLTRRCNTSPT